MYTAAEAVAPMMSRRWFRGLDTQCGKDDEDEEDEDGPPPSNLE